jgi:hypothetical protein
VKQQELEIHLQLLQHKAPMVVLEAPLVLLMAQVVEAGLAQQVLQVQVLLAGLAVLEHQTL